MKNSLFTNKATIYDKYRLDYPKSIKSLVSEIIPHTDYKRVLELGCGTGKFTSLLKKYNSVHVLEQDKMMLEILKLESHLFKKIIFHNVNAEETNLPSNYFDCIFSAQAFHLFDSNIIGQEINRLLKPNGKIFLVWYHWKKNKLNDAIKNIFLSYNKNQLIKRTRIDKYSLKKIFPNSIFYKLELNDHTINHNKNSFIKSMLSSSYAPTEESSNYDKYINEMENVFFNFSNKDSINLSFQFLIFHN